MKTLVVEGRKDLSIRRQCEILEISRNQYYYKPKEERKENLEAMRVMDEFYLDHPTAGVKTMRSVLQDNDLCINEKCIRRLMRKMNIRAIYPLKSLTALGRSEYKHPYLLRGLNINHVNQVWSIDISYIPMRHGFMYLTAIIDVYSRKILAWNIGNSLETSVSLDVLSEAIRLHGVPEIVNSDQGCQYTSKSWIEALTGLQIRISMDGKGRAKDNIWIERFWRTIKREYIYLNPSENGLDLYRGIKGFMDYYNNKRHHQGINGEIPANRYEENRHKFKTTKTLRTA